MRPLWVYRSPLPAPPVMSIGPAAYLNGLPAADAHAALLRCCASQRWVDAMIAARPFGDDAALFAAADREWRALGADDWREAFAAHPRIGDREATDARHAGTRDWSRREQAGTATADPAVLAALAEGNRVYERRFGHVFLISAAGRSADEMLAALRRRLGNEPAAEMREAANEQAKIMRLRLERLVER